MANIEEALLAIRQAIYGEEVRGSIVTAIQNINEESTNAKSFAEGEKESAKAYAAEAAKQVSAAREELGNVRTLIEETKTEISNDLEENDQKIQQIIDDLRQEKFISIYPVGSIYMSVNATNPSELFGGTWVRYGEGRVLIGVDENDPDLRTAGATGGAKSHSITTTELPSHHHTVSGTTADQNANHTHSFNVNSGTVSADHYHALTTTTNGIHDHLIRGHDGSFGGSNRGSVMDSASNTYTSFTNPGGDHYHSANTGGISANHVHNVSGTTGGISANHAHTFSANTSAIGSNQAMSLMQPYITCYIWQRTE